MACSATALFSRNLFAALASPQSAPSDGSARVYVDSNRTIAPLDRKLFGSFLEHLGRAIYEGVYDPGSKLSDPTDFGKTYSPKSASSEFRSFGIPGGTLSPATTGSTESVRKKTVRERWTRLGTPSNRTSSGPTSSWRGVKP